MATYRVEGVLSGMPPPDLEATSSMLDRLAAHDPAAFRRLDEAAWRACQGGRGGPSTRVKVISRAIAGDLSLVGELVAEAIRRGEIEVIEE
jgi:hypothetical protein